MSTTTRTGLTRYGLGAILFHWAIALLIIANLVLAEMAEGLRGLERGALMGPHTAIGISILVLSIGRILWRVTHPAPPMQQRIKGWERLLARIVHVIFYILIIAVPLTGWMVVSTRAGSSGIDYFGLFNVPPLPVSTGETPQEIAEVVHKNLGGAFIYLIALHVLGALKHQFYDKMPYFHRMWPG